MLEAGPGEGQDYTPLRSFRYERKFLVQELRPYQVQGIVKMHPLLFSAAYPPRYVNNLYLDTPGLSNYHDHIAGAACRRKVRIRWYGEPFGEILQPLLEFKLRDGAVGTKRTFPLRPFCLDAGFCRRGLEALARLSDLPEAVWRDLRDLQVVLFNRYFRHYYASRDGCFRITVDTDLVYYRAHGILSNLFLHRQSSDWELVVELKYEVEHEARAERAAGFFPFRVTRNSKYVQGMERVYF